MARGCCRHCSLPLLLPVLWIFCVEKVVKSQHYKDIPVANVSATPRGHPKQYALEAQGLPTGCITYKERYGPYEDFSTLKGQHWDPNAENPDATEVVLVRIHFGLKFPHDLLLHFRALMAECVEAGLHVYLLYEDHSDAHPAAGDSPWKFRSAVPVELRPIAFPFSQEVVRDMYPELHSAKPFMREYLPCIYFLHRFPAYRFAWRIEHDVRYTGRSWGQLLNGILNHGVEAIKRGPSPGRRRLLAQANALSRGDQEKRYGGRRNLQDSLADTFRSMHAELVHAHRVQSDQPSDGREGGAKELPAGDVESNEAERVANSHVLHRHNHTAVVHNASDQHLQDGGVSGSATGLDVLPTEQVGRLREEAATVELYSDEQRKHLLGPAGSEAAVLEALKSIQLDGADTYPSWQGWTPYRGDAGDDYDFSHLGMEEVEPPAGDEEALHTWETQSQQAAAKQEHAGFGEPAAPLSLDPPPQDAVLPDLILFGDGIVTDEITAEVKPRDMEHWNFTRMHTWGMQEMGISRRMAQTLHAYSVEGFGGYLEEFITTLAMELHMRVVSVPVSLWNGESNNCCTDHGKRYYTGWKETGECRHYALVHPIKIKAEDISLWGNE